MVLEQNLSLVNKVNRLLRWGHWFTFFNVLLALPISLSFFLADPLPPDAIGWIYLLLNWLGHTAFICLLFFIVTIFPVSLLFPSQRHVRGIAALLASVGLVALIFDAYVYHSLGYHAGSASFDQTVDLLRQQVVTNLRNFLLITASVGVLLLVIELVLSNFCWKKIERLKHSGIGAPAMLVLLGSFVASHLLHIWGDATQVTSITRQDNTLPLSYPATARTVLNRYQIITSADDPQQAKSWLQQALSKAQPVQLSCKPASQLTPLDVWIVKTIDTELVQLLQLQNFKTLPQHLAPRDETLAITNLLHGQLASADNKQAPAWWQQIPAGLIHVDADLQQLPWLREQTNSSAAIRIHLQPDTSTLLKQLKQRPANQQVLIIEMSGQGDRFALGPAQIWYHWPELRQQRFNQVSQHLDLMPTLLTYAGCHNQQPWLGENWLAATRNAKLNVIGSELYAFRKDKMLVVQEDGQYSVWSAGTFVALEQKPDLPLLTDALNRLTTTATAR
jgi:membrane-anchored protein YejM (alkaline phosphatase superfamily)